MFMLPGPTSSCHESIFYDCCHGMHSSAGCHVLQAAATTCLPLARPYAPTSIMNGSASWRRRMSPLFRLAGLKSTLSSSISLKPKLCLASLLRSPVRRITATVGCLCLPTWTSGLMHPLIKWSSVREVPGKVQNACCHHMAFTAPAARACMQLSINSVSSNSMQSWQACSHADLWPITGWS